MLEGSCPKCQAYFFGYQLLNPRNQSCPTCGVGLEITEDGEKLYLGYSPFTGEEYIFNPTNNSSSIDKKKHRFKKP